MLLGLLAGIAAGATLGILFAPDKGKTTRRKIVEKGDDYAEELGEKIGKRFNEVIESVTDKFEKVRDEATRLVHVGKSKAEAVEAEMVASTDHKHR